VYPIPRMRHDELPPEINAITGAIVDGAMCVHRELGPGLLESVYQDALLAELTHRGLEARAKVKVPVRYRGIAADALHGVHWAQVMSYLRLARKPVGLLINFHEFSLKDGIRRVVPPTLSNSARK
jgi:hypothetical protein